MLQSFILIKKKKKQNRTNHEQTSLIFVQLPIGHLPREPGQ